MVVTLSRKESVTTIYRMVMEETISKMCVRKLRKNVIGEQRGEECKNEEQQLWFVSMARDAKTARSVSPDVPRKNS